MRIETLSFQGHGGAFVPNRFFRAERAAHLAVVLPGLNYTCDGPLLYFATSQLLEVGADVLQVDCSYGRRPGCRGVAIDDHAQRLEQDSAAACDAALAQGAYESITLIGKSLGTLAMGHLLTNDARLRNAHAIWFTPLLRNTVLREQLLRIRQPSLFVIGTADHHYDPAVLTAVSAGTAHAVVVEGADHGLDIPGDVVGSVRAVEQVMLAVRQFVTEPPTAGKP